MPARRPRKQSPNAPSPHRKPRQCVAIDLDAETGSIGHANDAAIMFDWPLQDRLATSITVRVSYHARGLFFSDRTRINLTARINVPICARKQEAKTTKVNTGT
jgi:hypothetical protein